MAKRVVTVTVGTPFDTGEECPACHFDSVRAILYFVDRSPRFAWTCGRCKERLRDV